MKKLFTVLILSIIGICAFAQTKMPTGLLNIEFGETQENAESKMINRGFTLISKLDKDKIEFSGKFSGRDSTIILEFYEDQFCCAFVLYEPDLNKTIDTFDKIVSDFKKVYGEPNIKKREFKYPYEEGDGHEETAIALNKTDIYCFWSFSNDNRIMVSIGYSKEPFIGVVYVNNPLYEKAKGEEEATNLSDL